MKKPWAMVHPRPLYFLASCFAPKCCLAAHKITSSGAMRNHPITVTRLPNTVQRLSFGPGIFGWTAIQVQANRVDKQLQIMPHIVLVPNTSALRVKTDGGMSVRRSGGVGEAKIEPNERHSRVKRIIVPEGWYFLPHHVYLCLLGYTASATGPSEERKRLADPQFPTLSHSLNRSRWSCRARFLGAADVKWHFHTSPCPAFHYRKGARCARALSSLLS